MAVIRFNDNVKTMKFNLLKVSALLFLLLLLYLLFWPVPISPQAWDAPPPADYSGDFAVNTALLDYTAVSIDGLHGPEAIVQGPTGELFASTHEGWILRWQPHAEQATKWIEVGGHPLGLDFDAAGNLWVANAYTGLMRITPAGEITTELNSTEQVAIRYADDVVVAPNGLIYLSDASTKFAAKQWGGTLTASLLDLTEHGLHGRIIEFNPNTQQSRVIMRDLSFANGVTMNENGDFLLVAETGGYRVWKYWLTGAKAGTHEVILDNLPGFPDNLHRGQAGRYWLGLTAPRVAVLDIFSNHPYLRTVMQRFPAFLRPQAVHYGVILAISDQGDVLHNWQDPTGAVFTTTGAFETAQYVFVASLTNDFIARYNKANMGVNQAQ